MDPINYSIQAPNPAQAVMQGLQGGFGIQQAQLQQQQQQLALAQQVQLQRDLSSFATKPNPSADDYAQLMARYPQLADKFKASYDVMNGSQQKEQLTRIAPVYAALRTGSTDVANDLLDRQAQAYENSGNAQGAQGARLMKSWIAQNPQSAMHIIGFQLAATQPDKFSDIVSNLASSAATDAKLPAEVAKGNADAAKAAVDAGTAVATAPYAAPQAQANVAKTNQDVEASKLQGRISDLNTQIAQTNSETDRGRLTLERDKLALEQQQLQQTRGQAVQNGQDAATQALQTLQQIKTHPGMSDNLVQSVWGMPGSKPGDLWGAALSKIPGTDRNALEGWVESLKGQLGFQNLMAMKQSSPQGSSGLGALSEGELKMLSNLAGNLNLNSKDFPTQIGRVEAFLNKSLAKGVASPNLPTSGGAFVMTSPKYGVITEGRINAILKSAPGASRDDVLRFLQAGPSPGGIPTQ